MAYTSKNPRFTNLTTTGTVSMDGAVTINESGADVDFRVEGDTETNLLFCDASTDRIGIGTNSIVGAKVKILENAAAYCLVLENDDTTNGDGLLIRAGGTSATSLPLYVSDETTNTEHLVVKGDGTAYFNGGGNVGFGTNSPNESIESGAILINSSGSFSGSGFILDKSGNNGRLHAYHSSGDAELSFETTTSGTNAERMRIDKDGNVGIGTNIPSYTLDVSSSGTTNIYAGNTSTGYAFWGLNTGGVATNPTVRIDRTADLSDQEYIRCHHNTATGTGTIKRNGSGSSLTFGTVSDRRIKHSFEPMQNTLDRLNRVNLVSFNYKEGHGDLTFRPDGVIAQEVHELFPEMVTKTDDGLGANLPEGQDPWQVHSSWEYVLIKAIQELSAKVEALETEKVQMQDQLTSVMARLDALENA